MERNPNECYKKNEKNGAFFANKVIIESKNSKKKCIILILDSKWNSWKNEKKFELFLDISMKIIRKVISKIPE